ncbi:MAG: hypothetical protein WCF99_00570 [Chloroflexales bacterium]
MRPIERIVAFILWGLVIVDVVLAILIATWQVQPSEIGATLLVISWLLTTLLIAGFGLPIVHRHQLGQRRAWLLMGGLCSLGALGTAGVLHIPEPHITLIITLLLPLGGAALVSAFAIAMFKYDLGAPAIAMITIMDIWGLFLAYLTQGSLITSLFQFMTTGSSPAIWLLNVLFVGSLVVLFLAALSFLWHTLRLLARELGASRQP